MPAAGLGTQCTCHKLQRSCSRLAGLGHQPTRRLFCLRFCRSPLLSTATTSPGKHPSLTGLAMNHHRLKDIFIRCLRQLLKFHHAANALTFGLIVQTVHMPAFSAFSLMALMASVSCSNANKCTPNQEHWDWKVKAGLQSFCSLHDMNRVVGA